MQLRRVGRRPTGYVVEKFRRGGPKHLSTLLFEMSGVEEGTRLPGKLHATHMGGTRLNLTRIAPGDRWLSFHAEQAVYISCSYGNLHSKRRRRSNQVGVKDE